MMLEQEWTPLQMNSEVRHLIEAMLTKMFILPPCAVPPGGVTAQRSPLGPLLPGTTVDLMCQATTGRQPVSYSWTDASGVAVSPDDTNGNITVTISIDGDFGMYTCTAMNDFGINTTTFDVEQAGRLLILPTVDPMEEFR